MSGKAIRETLGFLSGGGGAGVATSVILVRNFFEDLRRLGASGAGVVAVTSLDRCRPDAYPHGSRNAVQSHAHDSR